MTELVESQSFEVEFELERKASKDLQITKGYVLNNVLTGLKNIFGEVGGGYPLELDSFEDVLENHKYKFVLNVPPFLVGKIQASLSLQGFYQGHRCAYHIKRQADADEETHSERKSKKRKRVQRSSQHRK